jgi:predicted phage tail protein
MNLTHHLRRSLLAVAVAASVVGSVGGGTARAANAAAATPLSAAATAPTRASTPDGAALAAVTAPKAPRSPTATPRSTVVILGWQAPSSNGGATINKYRVQRATSATGPWKTIAEPTVRRYGATGLKNGTRYYFRVAAHNAAGWSTPSKVVSAVPRTVPTAPRSPTSTAGNTSVKLTWLRPASNGGAAIDKYRVQRAVAGGSWKTIAHPTTRSYTATGLTNGAKYSFRIRAHNATGYGAFGTAVNAVPRTVPSVPRSPNAMPGDASITVSWQPPLSTGGATIDYYEVERLEQGTSQWASIGSPKGTPMVVSGTNGTSYSVRIRAHNIAGPSPWSTVVSATAGAPTAPLSPSAIAGIAVVELHWSAPSSAGGAVVDYYEVQQSTTGTSGWTTIASPTVLSYPVGGLTHGKYYFRILAHNTFGLSQASTIVSAVPFTAPPAPQSLAASPGDGIVTLSWQPPSSDGGAPIDYYYIEVNGPNGPVSTFTTANLSVPALGLTNGTLYTFHVYAHNAAGIGEYSTAWAEPFSVPSAPLALTAANQANGGVQLTWTAPLNDGGKPVDDYAVYKATNPAGPWQQISQTGLQNFYSAYGLTTGTEYYFYVVAHSAAGWGAASGVVSAIPTTWPSGPICAAFQEGGAGSDKLRMNWSPPQSDGGEPIQFYRFEVWQNGVMLYKEDIMPNVGTVSHPFPFGTYYPVQVTAKNAAGFGVPCIVQVVLYP